MAAHSPFHHLKNTHTEGKPLTSPSTNLEIDPAQAILAANVMVRSFVLDFQQRATRDWEAAQQRWRKADRRRGRAGRGVGVTCVECEWEVCVM